MNSIFGKLRDFVGFNEPMDYEYEYDDMDGNDYQQIYQQEHTQPLPEEDAPVSSSVPGAGDGVTRYRCCSDE